MKKQKPRDFIIALAVGLFPITFLYGCLAATKCERETIKYSAYKCHCIPPEGFGMPTKITYCDSGSITIRKSDIVIRSARYIKVADGTCTYLYAIQVN